MAELEFQYDHSVVRKDVSTAASSEISRNVIVLASLDESLLFQDESAQDYEVVQSLLTSEDKNITWVLEGALMECSRPEHAIIFGLARSARSENDRLSLKILDVADKADSRYISSRVLQVLEPSFYDDEVADRNGVLFVPRVEADDVLNSKLPNGVQRDVTIQPLKQDRPLALKFGKAGLLETLAFGDDVEILDTELADDELEIR